MAKNAALAREAILVQDACNPSGVAHLLVRMFQELEHDSTKAKCEDPIIRMTVMKLADLCRVVYTFDADAYAACKEMAGEEKADEDDESEPDYDPEYEQDCMERLAAEGHWDAPVGGDYWRDPESGEMRLG